MRRDQLSSDSTCNQGGSGEGNALNASSESSIEGAAMQRRHSNEYFSMWHEPLISVSTKQMLLDIDRSTCKGFFSQSDNWANLLYLIEGRAPISDLLSQQYS
jgi:hypothetical protein